MSADARKRFELENKIENADAVYKYDAAAHQALCSQKPWAKEYVVLKLLWYYGKVIVCLFQP